MTNYDTLKEYEAHNCPLPSYEEWKAYCDAQKRENEMQDILQVASDMLTEQLKKGELPEGFYYLKVYEELANYPVIAECVIDCGFKYRCSYFYDYDENKIEQVLARVPTYQEYLALQSDSLAKNEGAEIIAELEAKVKKQLEMAVEALATIEKKSDKFDDSWGVQEQLDYIKAEAQSVLYNIKELDK